MSKTSIRAAIVTVDPGQRRILCIGNSNGDRGLTIGPETSPNLI